MHCGVFSPWKSNEPPSQDGGSLLLTALNIGHSTAYFRSSIFLLDSMFSAFMR